MDDGLKSRVISWLAEEFDVSSEPVPRNAPLEWVVKAYTKGPAKAVVVVQKPQGKDAVVLTLGVGVHEKHLEGLRRLSPEVRRMIMLEVHRGAVAACPVCAIMLQVDGDILRSVMATRVIYLDSLTRQELLDSIKMLLNVLALVSSTLITKLGSPGGARVRHEQGFM